MDQQKNKINVIVIGAGAAGLTAADRLQKQGYRVQILEASDIYGGRLQKNTDFSDYTIDLGGEELYNPEGEYFKMCMRAGADIFRRKDNQIHIEHPQKKKMMSIEEFELKHPQEANVITLFCEHYKKYPRDNRPLSELYDQYRLNPIFKFWAIECMGTESGGDWRLMSNRQIGGKEHVFPTFEDCFMIRNMGHFDVLTKNYEHLIKQIKYKKEVYKINYASVDEKVTVSTKDGSTYNADYVICTVSIGILQKKKIKFEPEMPIQKIQAIQSIGSEPAGKLFLKFRVPIFEQKMSIFYIDYLNLYGWIHSDERSKSEKEYVICFFVACENCENLDQDPIKFITQLLEHLQNLTKIKVKENYEKFLWKNWGADPFVLTGHSYDSILQQANSRKIIAQNINERIFFAGEACNFQLKHGGINGAVDTGLRVANEIQQTSQLHYQKQFQPKL